VLIAGWMYWDAEINQWRPHSAVPVLDTSLDAFAHEPESAGKVCRPCSEESHAECEGAHTCKCPCRDELSLEFLVHELEEDWNWAERAKTWPN
jgi:hypothetical protein